MEYIGKHLHGQVWNIRTRPSSLVSEGIGGNFTGIKWPRLEADHLPLSSSDVKNAWSYASIPPCLAAELIPEMQGFQVLQYHAAILRCQSYYSFMRK